MPTKSGLPHWRRRGMLNICRFSRRFLVQDHNAVIDILTLRKQTPLHLAAAAGQLTVCTLLLELGASIDATDDQGQKPIHVAAQNNFPEVVKLFLQQHPSLVMACTKVKKFFRRLTALGCVVVLETPRVDPESHFGEGVKICILKKILTKVSFVSPNMTLEYLQGVTKKFLDKFYFRRKNKK